MYIKCICLDSRYQSSGGSTPAQFRGSGANTPTALASATNSETTTQLVGDIDIAILMIMLQHSHLSMYKLIYMICLCIYS